MSRHPAVAAALLIAFVACVPAPTARPPIVTDRPRFTQSPTTVPARAVQVEGAVGTYRSRQGPSDPELPDDRFEQYWAGLVARAGVTSRVEVSLGLPSYAVLELPSERVSGFADAFVGGKLRLLAPGADASPLRPDAALSGSLTLPVGSRRFRYDRVQPMAALDLAWDLTPRLELGADVTYRRHRSAGGGFDQLARALLLGGRPIASLFLFAEVVRTEFHTSGAPGITGVNGGASWRLTPDLQLDATVNGGRGGGSTGHGAELGFGVRF